MVLMMLLSRPFFWYFSFLLPQNGMNEPFQTIRTAMLNESDELWCRGDQRTTIYNHSQAVDHRKHTRLHRARLPSSFYCPSEQLLDRGDGKAFSSMR